MNFKTIRILGKTYSIREDIELHDDGKFGLCNHRKQEITVYPDQHEDQIRDTILHESIHAIDYGISL